MDVFHCDGKLAQNTKSGNRYGLNKGRSAPAMRIRTGGMSSHPSPWDGLAHLFTFFMSNELEDNKVEVSMGWFSECNRFLIMRLEGKFTLNASSISSRDFMHKLLNMMNFGTADELDCEGALKVCKAFQSGLGDPRANLSCLLKFSSDSVNIFFVQPASLH